MLMRIQNHQMLLGLGPFCQAFQRRRPRSWWRVAFQQPRKWRLLDNDTNISKHFPHQSTPLNLHECALPTYHTCPHGVAVSAWLAWFAASQPRVLWGKYEHMQHMIIWANWSGHCPILFLCSKNFSGIMRTVTFWFWANLPTSASLQHSHTLFCMMLHQLQFPGWHLVLQM